MIPEALTHPLSWFSKIPQKWTPYCPSHPSGKEKCDEQCQPHLTSCSKNHLWHCNIAEGHHMHGSMAGDPKPNGMPHGTLGFSKWAPVLLANSTSKCKAMAYITAVCPSRWRKDNSWIYSTGHTLSPTGALWTRERHALHRDPLGHCVWS